jgi:peptidoglycan/LPS O-acetylase OafA/YrhL
MGTLRTIFALTVVFAHVWPSGSLFVGGRNAVQLFYVISGFLISYILVERKSYPRVADFYLNRYLRLYPIYCFVAAASLVAIILTRQSMLPQLYTAAPPAATALLTLSNIFLFGQDWVMFAAVKHHALVFSTDFFDSELPLYRGLLVPQAWTLGVELSFYLLAPFILPRRRLLYALLLASLALRAGLFAAGLGTRDPWTYRFFPAELALFLAGSLAHQILLPRYRRLAPDMRARAVDWGTYFLIAISLLYATVPVAEPWKMGVLFAAFILLLPLAFLFQNRHCLDNWLGDLSYPIYIGHILAIELVHHIAVRSHVESPYGVAIVGALACVALAIALNRLIGRPFEKLRDRFRSRPRPPGRDIQTPAAAPALHADGQRSTSWSQAS